MTHKIDGGLFLVTHVKCIVGINRRVQVIKIVLITDDIEDNLMRLSITILLLQQLLFTAHGEVSLIVRHREDYATISYASI